jgi:hypothetical protein
MLSGQADGLLSDADKGWGRLLIRIASKRHGRQVRKRYRSLAG